MSIMSERNTIDLFKGYQPEIVETMSEVSVSDVRGQRRVTFALVWTLQTVCVRSYIFWSECDGDQGIKLTLTSETKQ